MRLPRDVISSRALLTHPRIHYQIALCIVCMLLAAASFHDVDIWQATHWAFGYDNGHVKRGLVGAAYQWLEHPVSIKGITIAYLTLATTVVTLFVYLVTKTFGPTYYASSAEDFTSSMIGIWLVTAPGIVPQMFFDTGRFDVFGVFLLLLSILAIHKQDKFRSFVFLLVLSIVSIQIHEAFFLWIPATAIALWIYRYYEARRDLWLVAVFITAATATTLYSGYSSYEDTYSLDETVALVNESAMFPADARSVEVHFRSLSDNVNRTWDRGWGEERRERLALAGFVILPYLVMFWLLARQIRAIDPARTVRLYLLLASALAPLALFVLGTDFGRWLGMMNASAVAIILFLVRRHPVIVHRLPQSAAWILVVGIIVQANLGPFGIEWIFPRADVWTAVQAIRSGL